MRKLSALVKALGNSKLIRAICISGAVFAAGCAYQPATYSPETPGVFWGIWHGFTILFSLIGEIFLNHRIYAFPNSGGWYDLGFVIGVAAQGRLAAYGREPS
jgi:hypothetical protein